MLYYWYKYSDPSSKSYCEYSMIVDEDNNYNNYYYYENTWNSDAFASLRSAGEISKIICITHSLGFGFFTYNKTCSYTFNQPTSLQCNNLWLEGFFGLLRLSLLLLHVAQLTLNGLPHLGEASGVTLQVTYLILFGLYEQCMGWEK